MLFDIKGKQLPIGADTESLLIAMTRHRNHGNPANGNRESHYNNMLCVAHISDLHTDSVRYKRFLDWVSKHKEFVTCAIETGDLVDSPSDVAWNYMLAAEDGYTDIDLLKVCGNHEKYYGGAATSEEVYNKWNCVTNTGKLYYYKDYPQYHVRIIVINFVDYDPIRTYINVYSQEQIDWLCETLQDAKTNGYAVIIAKHNFDHGRATSIKESFYDKYVADNNADWNNNDCNGPIIEDIVDAFKHGTSLNRVYNHSNSGAPSVTVDVTFDGNGDFICYLNGHYHIDIIGASPNYPDQIYLGINTGCLESKSRPTAVFERWTNLPRVEGTDSEDCFNVYVFDTVNKQIKVLRIGSHTTCEFEERLMEIYTY